MALSESITLIAQPKKKKITQGVSKTSLPTFNAKTINAQAQSVGRVNRNAAQ